MHTIAFICISNGGPVIGSIVECLRHNGDGAPTLLGQGITNSDGYIAFPQVPDNVLVDVYVVTSGYRNYHQQIQLTAVNTDYKLTLIPSFSKPSRDRIITVKANLCNLYDADNNPIFEPMINWLILNKEAKADNWIERAKVAGSTHYNIVISGNYRNNPIPGTDFTQDLPTFNRIIRWIKSRNLIPIVKLAFDGQQFDPVGWTYGWQWGMDNMERIANGLSEHIDSVLWSTGFDGCFPDWSPQQTIDMLRKMRAVFGPTAQLDTEFAGPGEWGYIHLGNGQSDWAADKLGILDHFSLEAQSFPIDTGDPAQQIATRLLGPNCLIGPQFPYYLQGLEKTISIDVYETVATWFYNGARATPQDAIDAANRMAAYGFKSFGNGVPSI